MRLTLIGGYLGAGKTTWLRHHLRHDGPRDAIVLVNEAAGCAVDDILIEAATHVLAGGCACCSGRDALIAALRNIADRCSAGLGPAHILLETSGLADPAAIIAAVQSDPVLTHHIRFDPIRVLVDAHHGLDQLMAEPLARRQVSTADILTLTKVDIARSAELARLTATLRALNPGARLDYCRMGEQMSAPALPPAPPDTLPEIGDDAPLPMPMVLDLPTGTDWTAFAVWLSALLHARGDEQVRIKGVVATPAGRLLLQTVRRVVQKPEILPDHSASHENRIVFIGRGIEERDLRRSFDHIVLGQASSHSSIVGQQPA